MSQAKNLAKMAQSVTQAGILGPTAGGTPTGGIPDAGPTGNLLISNGTVWTSQAGLAGPTGPQGPAGTNGIIGVDGATGPTGPSGLGFTIAKTYSSVAQLTADTSPTGIVSGQFALIDTGDVNNSENSRLYVWNGTSYTYTSDLSGAQGIVGPTGAQGPTGPAGAAPTGGASFKTGDVILTANAAEYPTPTWVELQGQMLDTGTYPGLDPLYTTNGSYSGIASQIAQIKISGTNTDYVLFGTGAGNGTIYTQCYDPLTGDFYVWDSNAAAGARATIFTRETDGRVVYTNNNLMSQVNADTSGVASGAFAISSDGQILVMLSRTTPMRVLAWKRKTLAEETSTGSRWTAVASINITTGTSVYYICINANYNVIVLDGAGGYNSMRVNPVTNSIDSFYSATASGGGASTDRGLDVCPTNNNIFAVVTSSASVPSKLLINNNGNFVLGANFPTGSLYSYATVKFNRAGTAVYVSRSTVGFGVEIYTFNAGGTTLTSQGAIPNSAKSGYRVKDIAFSAGDEFMAVTYTVTGSITIFQRNSPGSLSYTPVANVPANQPTHAPMGYLEFDPIYNILTAMSTTTAPFNPYFWKGTTKTVLPNLGTPGQGLKYYMKTGS